MTEQEKVKDLTDKIQSECHAMVEKIMLGQIDAPLDAPFISYQDATNVFLFLFTKIAELQVANEKLLDLYKQSLKTDNG